MKATEREACRIDLDSRSTESGTILGHLPESAYVLRCFAPSGLSRFDEGTRGADLILEFGQPEPITNDPRWPSPSFVDLPDDQSHRRNPFPFCDPQVPNPLISSPRDLVPLFLFGRGREFPERSAKRFTSSVLPDSGSGGPSSPPLRGLCRLSVFP